MICVRKLLCTLACCYLLAACGSDERVYTGVENQSTGDQNPEDSENPVTATDEINGESTAGSDNPELQADDMNGQMTGSAGNTEPSADTDNPTATLQSPSPNQTIANFPFELSGTARSDSSEITAVEILVFNTATMENLQADGTMGPYTELQAKLDNPGENTTDWSLNVSSLPPGPYYIAVRASNGESQVSEWQTTDFTVASSNDSVAPTVTLH